MAGWGVCVGFSSGKEKLAGRKRPCVISINHRQITGNGRLTSLPADRRATQLYVKVNRSAAAEARRWAASCAIQIMRVDEHHNRQHKLTYRMV